MWIDDGIYQQIKSLMPICCVDLVLCSDNGVLLCKRNNEPFKGQWFMPGGRVWKGETLEEAVHRKAWEELGIDVVIGRQLPVQSVLSGNDHTIAIPFIVMPKTNLESVKLDGQHSDTIWVNPDDYSGDLHWYVKRCVEACRGISHI